MLIVLIWLCAYFGHSPRIVKEDMYKNIISKLTFRSDSTSSGLVT